jgi:hypothetical protein
MIEYAISVIMKCGKYGDGWGGGGEMKLIFRYFSVAEYLIEMLY